MSSIDVWFARARRATLVKKKKKKKPLRRVIRLKNRAGILWQLFLSNVSKEEDSEN